MKTDLKIGMKTEMKMRVKKRRTALILMIALGMMLASVMPAFAADGSYTGKNAKKIPVLTYHNVITDANKAKTSSPLAISKSDFERQMTYLHDRGYRTISCDELYLWRKGKIKLPKKSVLITFDNGLAGMDRNALPVLQKYGMKATSFLIGSGTLSGESQYITYDRVKEIQATYPDLEFQSHTYDLHRKLKEKGSYKKVLADAKMMKALYDPKYVAYPFGKYTKGMIKAYKKTGIRMAFTYGKNAYATRKQNLYKISRISVNGNASFSKFEKWFR